MVWTLEALFNLLSVKKIQIISFKKFVRDSFVPLPLCAYSLEGFSEIIA
jgi:hypothetical protein